jgi:hypothetical protein
VFVSAFISESGFNKDVPAIAPVAARKCRLDIEWSVFILVKLTMND